MNYQLGLMPDLTQRLTNELAPLLGKRGTTPDQLFAAKQKALIKIAEGELAAAKAKRDAEDAAKPSADDEERARVRGLFARRQANKQAAMAPAAREAAQAEVTALLAALSSAQILGHAADVETVTARLAAHDGVPAEGSPEWVAAAIDKESFATASGLNALNYAGEVERRSPEARLKSP